MRISEILTNANEFLPRSTTSRIDLELLLTEALHQPRSFLYANDEYELTQEQKRNFQILYQRRLCGEPIAYILGRKEFWSLELAINEKVLIPRPETELLVEIILQLEYPDASVADLGTGSGAIAVALAKERPGWNIIATDISRDALQIASYNAMKLQIQNIEFYYGDWCGALPYKKIDIIVSNPPYIAENDPHLQKGDVSFEPHIALASGDGFSAMKKIIIQAKNKLKVGGLLVLEHGHDQSNAVQQFLAQNGYHNITPHKDLANICRAITAEV